jgi:hypothetical protein
VLACRKCHQQLPEGLAQQSLCELETILLARCSSIAAHRQAMNKGPLCDPCFARWQIAFQSGDRRSAAPDTSIRSDSADRLGMHGPLGKLS